MPPDDDLIDAAPCPKCKSPLAVVADDLGHLIECPSCGTQSRARRADSPAAPSGDAPRRRNWDDERRPTARNRDRERDDVYEDDDEDRRERRRPADRRGRSRYRDDDYDLPRPSRPGEGVAVGAAVMNFVFAAVALIEGICVGFFGSALVVEGPRGGAGVPFGSSENAGMVFLGFGVCNLIGVGLMIPAGVGLLTRREYGRILGFLSAGLALIFILEIVVILIALFSADRTAPARAVVLFLFPILLWLGYAITSLILPGKVRSEPR